MTWAPGRRRQLAAADIARIRAAIRDLVETERFDAWLTELPEQTLVRFMAPLEMLTFHYLLDPPRNRHLLRAARVVCQAMSQHLDTCPADLAAALRQVDSAIAAEPGPRARRTAA
jgi:hypothetical protein